MIFSMIDNEEDRAGFFDGVRIPWLTGVEDVYKRQAFTSSRAAPPISRARWEGQGSGFWREMLFRSGFLMSTCTAAA